MGKKLIIKGADFSQNGIHEEVVILDVSALYNKSGVQITAENLSNQPNSEKVLYFAAGVNGLIQIGSNNTQPIFGSKIELENGYTTLAVHFANMVGTYANNQYFFGIGFANENDRLIKAYGPIDETPGEWYVKVASDFSGEIPIPEGTAYIYITDIIANTAALETHSVILKKTVID